jgi:uncharacterized membrane protein YdbT with pleckstrin-like domain
MGYIDHSLGRNETLLYRARFPWFYRVGAWTLLFVFLVAGAVAHANDLRWVAAALWLVGLVLFLTAMVPVWTTEIGVTNQRLIYKTGLIWRNTHEVQLRAIEEVDLHQGVLGRLLDFGRLQVHGTGADDVVLPNIDDPVGLRKALQEGMASAQPAQAPAPAPAHNEAPHSAA